MIRVLQIRETPLTKCAGIDANCQGLIQLFSNDCDVEMLQTINYTRHTIPFLHQYYLDEKEIYGSIEKLKPDIIHIHGAFSFTLWVAVKCAKRFNLPIVFSPHFHPFWALSRPFMGKIFFNFVTKSVLRDINAVFTINNEDTSFFKRYHNNVYRIPHWTKFSIPDNKPEKNPRMVLFVGRLNESNKGFEHLYHLPEGKYEIHCVGGGDIKLRSDMVRHFNITSEELAQLYKQASLLVVPSRYEAFSYVSLEALSNYTPVVMSNRVRIADYLHDFSGVRCFQYQDYNDFATRVDETIGMEVNTHSISDIFSPLDIKKKYKAVYQAVFHHNQEK